MRLLTLTVVLALASGPARSQEDPARGDPFGPGWYAAPMLSFLSADSQRCGVDDALGGALVLGNRGDFASLELMAHVHGPGYDCTYTAPDPNDASQRITLNERGDLKLTGVGLGMLVGPFFEDGVLSRMFGVVGIGINQRDNHPQYASDDSTIYGDAGVGYLQPFTLFGWNLAARAELRYRYDVQQPPRPEALDPSPPSAYGDVLFNLGVQVPFTRVAAVTEPAPAPVGVVPPAWSDADNDGVIDDRDQCPGTPAGSYVDNVGCARVDVPAPAAVAAPTLDTAKAGDTIVLRGVNFDTARDTLTVNARNLLDSVADSLNKRPQLRIEIGGHTDSQGSESYNQDLSDRRAASVVAYLVERGVEATRLSSVGYGELRPIDSNETGEGRERNRRVELKVLE